MLNATRLAFTAYCAQVARLNGVENPFLDFTVAPVVEQKLIERLALNSDFLSRVNSVPVAAQEGARVGVGITRPIASRTNTAGGTRRVPIDPTDTSDEGGYRCEKTNSDTVIKYAKLDAWAHRPEFQQLIRDAILKQKARDRIMIGWNGTSVAATTDIAANPKLQDVNKGWIHKLRTARPANVLSDGGLTTSGSAIYVSEGGAADYRSLDALVFDNVTLLDEWHRQDSDLVVICGSDLVHDKYFNIVNAAGDKATEQLARDVVVSSQKLGGRMAVTVPFFPANALAITTFSNLSIYTQIGTARRHLKEEPALDQVENYESINEAYVVEDYGLMCLVENIVIGAKP